VADRITLARQSENGFRFGIAAAAFNEAWDFILRTGETITFDDFDCRRVREQLARHDARDSPKLYLATGAGVPRGERDRLWTAEEWTEVLRPDRAAARREMTPHPPAPPTVAAALAGEATSLDLLPYTVSIVRGVTGAMSYSQATAQAAAVLAQLVRDAAAASAFSAPPREPLIKFGTHIRAACAARLQSWLDEQFWAHGRLRSHDNLTLAKSLQRVITELHNLDVEALVEAVE